MESILLDQALSSRQMQEDVEIVNFEALQILELILFFRLAGPIQGVTNAGLQGKLNCVTADIYRPVIPCVVQQHLGIL